MIGDPEATLLDTVRDTYRATLPQVYGYLVRRLDGARNEAEELTQDTYLAYVAALRNGQTIENPPAWLQTVARNKLVDHLRRGQRRNRPVPVEPNDWPVIVSRVEAESLLHALPRHQRLAMILHHLDDLPIAEVAALLGRSVRATESLLARARKTLARRLTEENR